MKRFSCECGNVLFFENSQCLQCGSDTGFDPAVGTMVKLTPESGLKRCDNGPAHGVCNWLMPKEDPNIFCTACRLNRTIPDLNLYGNLALWARMESAKRRLLATLLGLGIEVHCLNEDPVGGLAFDFIQTLSNPPVTTGYAVGVITVNLQEADDAVRERTRQQLGESSRTLLGHFRHETGHYFWERWFGILNLNHPLRRAFGELFGDASLDYTTAMNRHYSQGPPVGWEQSYISAYASMHPWEDWAETWSHYLQILDGLESCEAYGLQLGAGALEVTPFPKESATLPENLPQEPAEDQKFLTWLHRWVRRAPMFNEISASLGQPALYPFVLSLPAVKKLRFVHYVASVGRTNLQTPAQAPTQSQSQSQKSTNSTQPPPPSAPASPGSYGTRTGAPASAPSLATAGSTRQVAS
ncbi:putative zinc-binding metallopeptidase [Roseimicrobium sp. ORNL1]|uniref:zinc-binding metallopeptidase family protein n=1 Tax=Roseimicrobium sp. ORNL1 TaxID=2711231 RepID=UPI0013E12D9A|nr:putative zinc-binding metallopeptidase [Roseimicrobium sp. ORNL1]QIF05505.1 hypothetical protein G5S37_29735 [Roseimicrobium sp. ORNL1]